MSTKKITGYAALAKGMPLEAFTYKTPRLKDSEVKVSISDCGLCFTDIQAIDDYYDITSYPFVPGHEVIGHVSEIGRSVSGLKEGDRVGIGWQGRSCGKCVWCRCGEVNLCQEIVDAASWTPYGGFSSSINVDADFAYKIPDTSPSDRAAVLMCAGITVFAPLSQYSSVPSLRIGVIGIGGLGHLAIQFAKAFGYEVTAISSSPGKKEEALALGADHFMVASDKEVRLKHAYYFDVLLCTAHAGIDWVATLEMLRKRGNLLLAGFADIAFKPIDLIAHQLSISGSFLGTQVQMKDMLQFANDRSIQPMIELMPMSQINQAIQRLKENKVRYRIVLHNDMN